MLRNCLIILLTMVTVQSAQAQRCVASIYWEGSRTANGERFHPDGLTAASKTLPFNSKVRVSYGGKSVVVRINDRGPFVRGRCLDLARGAARKLGILEAGVVTVHYEVIG